MVTSSVKNDEGPVEMDAHAQQCNDSRAQSEKEELSECHTSIYWRLAFLNLVVLWSYQSLISAQNYYIKFFPSSHLDFWGTVCAGSSMFFFQVIQLYFGLYKYGFHKRIVCGYIGYVFVSVLVISVKNPVVLILSFAAVGGMNTMTESPIYGIAGLFSTGSFSQAVQLGNGLAGLLNVTCNTIIRLVIFFVKSSIDEDQLSFYIFMSICILFSLLALYVYYRLIRLPPIDRRMTEQKNGIAETKVSSEDPIPVGESQLSFWQLTKIYKVHLFVQFYVLFISLLVWPGFVCQSSLRGWFANAGHRWWCSPMIIGTFNGGDLIGRTIALRLHRYFNWKITLISSLLRTFFLLLIFFRHQLNNIAILLLLTGMGVTNGLLTTVTFMVRPRAIRGLHNCERAAYLMTTALYAGIASGSILAAILSLTNAL